MSLQPIALAELQSLSFMLIDNNLTEGSLVKPSQENISLTYTASMENVEVDNLDISSIMEIADLQTSIEQHSMPSRNSQTVRRYFISSKLRQNWSNKDVFKKKELLKIAHLELSLGLHNDKPKEQKPQHTKPRRTLIKGNTSGLHTFHKQAQECNKNQPKAYVKIKDLFNPEGLENMEASSLTRSTKSYSMKNGNQAVRKINFSNKKFDHKRVLSCQTQRRYNKFPLIKGSNFHKSAPASLGKSKKIIDSHENAEFNDNFVVGKTFKLRENDEKAKKYLKRVIQNRNSIIHFSDKRRGKLFKNSNEDFQQR